MAGSDGEVHWVYVTAPSREVALDWARRVIAERLAACANVSSPVTSVYEWQGELVEESEVVVVMKTLASSFEALRARLVELHPYEVPCIVALPLGAGHRPFLDWVRGQVGPLRVAAGEHEPRDP